MGFLDKMKDAMGLTEEDEEMYEENENDTSSNKDVNPVHAKAAIVIYELEDNAIDLQLKTIIKDVRRGKITLLNCGSMHEPVAQRLIDCLTGACLALDGTFEKLEERLFLFVPAQISVYNTNVEKMTEK